MERRFKNENRGGVRPGSGRPTKSASGARITFSVMVSPATRQRITALRSMGVKIGESVDEMIEQLAIQHGIE